MKNARPAHLVDVEVLSRALSLSRSAVLGLAQQGIIPKAGRGRFDLVACAASYITYVRQQRGDPAIVELRQVRVARGRLELDARRRELEHGDVEMVPLAEARVAFAGAVEEYVGALSHLAAAAAPKLAGLSDAASVYAVLDPLVVQTVNEGWARACRKLGVVVDPTPSANGSNGHAR
jgi:hypothetical protein